MNKKSPIDLTNMCRTCMKQFSKFENTSNRMQNILEIADGCKKPTTIMQILQMVQPDIKVDIQDNLPMLMCINCIQKLLSTYEFLEMYKESDKNLRKALSSTAEYYLTDESFCTYDIYGTNIYSLEIEQLNNKVMEKVDGIKIDCVPVLKEHRNIEKSYLTSIYSDSSEDEWLSDKNSKYQRNTSTENMDDFYDISNDSITDNDQNETISLEFDEINDDLNKTENEEENINTNIENIDNDNAEHKNNTKVITIKINETRKRLDSLDDLNKTKNAEENINTYKENIDNDKSDHKNNTKLITKKITETKKLLDSPITKTNLQHSDDGEPSDVAKTNLQHSDDGEPSDVAKIDLQDNEVSIDNNKDSNHKNVDPKNISKKINVIKEQFDSTITKTNLQHNDASSDDSDHETIATKKIAWKRKEAQNDSTIENQAIKENNLSISKSGDETVKHDSDHETIATKKIARKRKEAKEQNDSTIENQAIKENNLSISKSEDVNVKQDNPFIENENGSVQCNNCKIVVDNLELWIEHMKIHHSEKNKKPRYECEKCGKVFAKSYYYQIHMRLHPVEKRHLCFECGKSFKTFGGFHIHMKRHTGEKDYQCSQCPKKFVCSSGLYNHMMVHTKEKPFVCDICGSAFHMAIHLRKHKLYHDGIKNYPCDYCDKRFVLAEQQRRHMRSHTGEKPYRCKYCSKAFSQCNDHIKHLRIHLGNNVYQCKLCPLRFPMARDLRKHFATHKDDDDETRARNLEARAEEEKRLEMELKSSI